MGEPDEWLSFLALSAHMAVSHIKYNDPRYTVMADPIHTYTCTVCGATQNVYGTAPFCEVCQKYMTESGGVKMKDVTEIKNRDWIPDETFATPENKGRAGRWDEEMVKKALAGKVMARDTGPDLQILINLDREMFTFQQVLLRFGNQNILTSIEEIGAAFTPFDSTQMAVKVGENIVMKDRRKPARTSTTIANRITVTGATSKRAWKEMLATFSTPDGTHAVYSMPDICAVIANAF
jgi:hypothetical protein